ANQALDLSAAGVKAVLIQTAQDVAGVGQATVGPDFSTGWGIADAEAAADLLRRPAGPGVAEETLAAAGTAGAYTQAFLVPSGEPELKVTLAWSDPAGSTTASQTQPRLVNDLDLRLINPTGGTVTPWSLNAANPGAAAVRNGGDDALNNVEQVSVLNPAAGVWQVQVTAKPTSFAGPQDFALAGPFSPASGPFTSDPADIMMVMDRSGSMNAPSATPGISKLGALKSAAEEVANFLEIVGGQQLGLVEFSTSASATSPAFDLQPIDAGSIGTAEAAIDAMTGGGATNIIDGVSMAVDQLSGPNAVNARQAVILFSDGRHNQPSGSDVADIDDIMEDDTLFYAIGFGTDVDSAVMPGVAANHNGLYLEEQSLSAAELSKLFLAVAGVAVDETIVVDPDYIVQPGGFAEQSVTVSSDDRAITFATHWNTTNPDQFRFVLNSPDDRCRVPLRGADGVEVRQGGSLQPYPRRVALQVPLHRRLCKCGALAARPPLDRGRDGHGQGRRALELDLAAGGRCQCEGRPSVLGCLA
ncbi:MAG: vWA domain-containing protein, partial [Pseudomonadota bacterium]